MKTIKVITILSLAASTLFSCKKNENRADGYGNFEATEVVISAESNGKLKQFLIKEGQVLKEKTFVGYIDTIQLSLKKAQLRTLKNITASKSKGVLSQINVLKAQLKSATINKTRFENLLKANAGTQKQLDDAVGAINVLKQQMNSVKYQNAPVVNELDNINIQIKQVEDQLQKSKIVNPINGTVLTTYAEENEITSFGKPLYKIADLNTMELRVYVSETQLASIKIRQKVTVKIDAKDGMKNYEGTITWIASEGEFTPKIIQTKEERTALVYAVKITVKNDGSLKIGMPAEMWLTNENK